MTIWFSYYFIAFIFPFVSWTGEHGHWNSGFQQACLQRRHHRCEAERESWVGLMDPLSSVLLSLLVLFYYINSKVCDNKSYLHSACKLKKSAIAWGNLLHLICFLTLQGVTLELLRGSAPAGPHLDVCCSGHHWPPLRPLPDPFRHLRLTGRFHHRHGSLHPSKRGKGKKNKNIYVRKSLDLEREPSCCFIQWSERFLFFFLSFPLIRSRKLSSAEW